MPRETVLYYAPEGDTRTAVMKSILVRLGVKIKNVPPGKTGETVGFLLGRKGFDPCEPEKAPELPEPLLLMDGFTGKRLEILLREMKKNRVRLPYKAVVTQTNLDWQFCKLYDALAAEHEAVAK